MLTIVGNQVINEDSTLSMQVVFDDADKFNPIDFDADQKILTLAATDSRRLAVVKNPCQSEGDLSEANNAPVIPAKAIIASAQPVPEPMP